MSVARVQEGAESAELVTPVSKGTTAEGGLPTPLGADPRSLHPAQVLALQRSIGNGAVARLLQRQVRVDGGRQRVNETHYKSGPGKYLGLRRSISGLIDDGIRRVFVDAQELEDYANGLTDYIGDVTTTSAGTFWYRLPKDKLTVLGEFHHDKNGNVEDVVRGLRTSRFMYEPFNEMADTKALPLPFTGMRAKLDEVNKGISISGFADPSKFDPHLENIVVKAMTGAAIFRNEFLPGKPIPRDDPTWQARPSTSDYSMGERVALYLSFGIHIAKDVADHDFGPDNDVESLHVHTARQLKETYLRHHEELDAFMKAKDTDPLIGIYELTSPAGYANLAALKAISLALHEYGAYYIKQMGAESKSAELEAEGEKLVGNLGADLDAFGPLRDLMMWQKIQGAKGYLLIGMGDAHREGLKARLNAAGIPHERVDEALVRQRDAINAVWAP